MVNGWNRALSDSPRRVLVSEKVTLEFDVSAIRTGDIASERKRHHRLTSKKRVLWPYSVFAHPPTILRMEEPRILVLEGDPDLAKEWASLLAPVGTVVVYAGPSRRRPEDRARRRPAR